MNLRSRKTAGSLVRSFRCAIYTRKSSDEGLDQEYNSLEAQRDAGLAFIASQRHEGWVALDDGYDDGGFSGGNMERPGLRRLLADIEAGLEGIAALPTLIIWGDGDFAFGDKELRRWQQTFTDHETVIVSGAGHFVPSDAPEQFAAAIRRWHSRAESQ